MSIVGEDAAERRIATPSGAHYRRRASRGAATRRFVLGAHVLLAVLATWTSTAFAQDEPVSPPVAQGTTDVPYPAGASGDTSVVLEIVVRADGAVQSALVVEGVPPFAEAARLAALSWQFAPARKGARAVAARIRVRVDFRQEPPSSASPSDTSAPLVSPPSTSAPAASAEPGPVEEVKVRGKRRDIGLTTIEANEIRELPGAFGDPFRAIEALPGVVPTASGLPYFYIRGAPPNDNGYSLDGVRVPLLFHVGVGQSVVHPGLVDRIDFFPGAAPAAYGGVAGAIIAGRTRDPAGQLRGEGNLRLLDAGALVESPFASGRGSALVAGRYGYPGLVLGAVTSDVGLAYWDYQARASWRLSERDMLSVFAFGSHDYFATLDRPTPAEAADGGTSKMAEQFVSDFHRVDVRYDRVLAGGGRARVAATVGHDDQGRAPTYVTNASASLRLEIENRLSRVVRLRAGAVARLDAYTFRQDATSWRTAVVPSSADPPPTNVSGGIFADVVWWLAPRVELVPGARVDVYASSRANAPEGTHTGRGGAAVPAIDPRLSARVTIAPNVAWLAALGLAHQYPTLRVGDIPAALVSVPGFAPGSAQLQTVAQASQGIEVALPGEVTLTTTGFLSGWSGLTDLTASCVQVVPERVGAQPATPQPPAPYVCPSNAPVHGRAYGVELLVRRALSKRLGGWISYTFSRSMREAHFITRNGAEAVATVPSEGDRTHVLNAILTYDLGRRWRAGGRFLFFTGSPYSKHDGRIPLPPYNDQRYDPFFRVDVRLEKRWPVGRDGSIAFVVEGQNVTLSRQAYGIECATEASPQQTTTRCTPALVGPITIPSVGVEAFF
ncbi:MAG TPA: TonB-dependent receptor [Labilithrix sp.]|nr:TonB-dependent receptor [Labilithrix sp.]